MVETIPKHIEKDSDLANKIYNLGFEVGYHKHSEIGWVAREYSHLIDKAMKTGLKNPEKLYEKGKIEGGKKKEIDLTVGESAGTKNEIQTITNADEKKDFIEKNSLFKKPSLFKIPDLTSRFRAVDIPSILKILK